MQMNARQRDVAIYRTSKLQTQRLHYRRYRRYLKQSINRDFPFPFPFERHALSNLPDLKAPCTRLERKSPHSPLQRSVKIINTSPWSFLFRVANRARFSPL